MPEAVAEVYDQSNNQPAEKPEPRKERQADHKVPAEQDAENWQDDPSWYLEGAIYVGACVAQNYHTGTYDDESEKRTY